MFTTNQQVWDDAVARNLAALRVVLAEVLGLLAVYGGMEAVKVPRSVRSVILRVLRPAESALRRLIVIAARDVRVPHHSETKSFQIIKRDSEARTFTQRSSSSLSFQLFDPRKRFGQRRITYTSLNPRVFFVAADPAFSPLAQHPRQPQQEPEPKKLAGAARLCRRLKALAAALEDVPRQAQRLARLRARRELRKSLLSPLRIGTPPGHRSIPVEDIDYVLAESHKYAMGVLNAPPNTS